MAEVIVHLVLKKLAEAAVKETLRLYGAGGKLESLKDELDFIRAFLKDAEAKQNLDHTVKTWVSKVQEQAYRIEDVIDTFMADVNDPNNQRGKTNVFMQVLKSPKKLSIVRKLTSEMDAIQTKLQGIKESMERYGINRNLREDLSSSAVLPRRPIRGVLLPDEDDPDVVGLETDKENIVKLLLDPKTPRRCVVSIVGQGGLGKTTLARKAYNSEKVKKAFEIRLWLSISQQFEFIDTLRMMLEGIRPLNQNEKDLLKDPASQQSAALHFAREVNKLLKENSYFIVMDDVWTSDLWNKVKEVLPDSKNGCRVLITTRFSEIAKKADSTYAPYNLRYLTEEESRELLLKKVFPFPSQDTKAYLDGLSDLPKKFARKCGHLPLALIVVGGRLSQESPTYNSWHKILEKFNWQDGDGKECIEILSTSYEDIPPYLKPCFMYFALFPEDYQIKAKSLIRLWVSEGFIHEKNGTTMEETAEDYLEELVRRSMIQVSERYYNGSIKYCLIHDLLRDLAIEKAKENNFLQIISNRDCSSSTMAMVRRAALHCNREDIMQYTGPNLRSLFYSVDETPNLARFRYLKILYGMKNYLELPSEISDKMTQLKYFGNFSNVVNYGEDEVSDNKCWKNISLMRNLQTLCIEHYTYDSRADCIWQIKTLRHAILPYEFPGPPPTAELPNLQTLKTVNVRESWLVEGWPKMPGIRVLRLINFPPNYKESFCKFLSEVQHLTSLHVCLDGKLALEESSVRYEGLNMSSFPSYDHMQSLCVYGQWEYCCENVEEVHRHNSMSLYGKWDCSDNIEGVNRHKSLDICLFPRHLIKLTIRYCNFREDPMPVIEKLNYLKKLVLISGRHSKGQLSCSAGGFPQLEYLQLQALDWLSEWKVEKGGMPLLKDINIRYCRWLRTIPELQHMTRLNKLTLDHVPRDLRMRLQGEESYKILNIPFITMYDN
ncbi:Disease resistance family protein [Rhynchospora pubera]|uniref:Disease resistance family protein n=1 Tax=Rhynchospora pubera TaxID=906938 RepID=A0AAV8HPU7_9POAL|nr:Disease resistance family protein [Rhynchospora pubera]